MEAKRDECDFTFAPGEPGKPGAPEGPRGPCRGEDRLSVQQQITHRCRCGGTVMLLTVLCARRRWTWDFYCVASSKCNKENSSI